jgi:hypothetical protein
MRFAQRGHFMKLPCASRRIDGLSLVSRQLFLPLDVSM